MGTSEAPLPANKGTCDSLMVRRAGYDLMISSMSLQVDRPDELIDSRCRDAKSGSLVPAAVTVGKTLQSRISSRRLPRLLRAVTWLVVSVVVVGGGNDGGGSSCCRYKSYKSYLQSVSPHADRSSSFKLDHPKTTFTGSLTAPVAAWYSSSVCGLDNVV